MTEAPESLSTRGYEFDAAENQVFSGLASAMKFVAYLLLIAGALAGFGAFAGGEWGGLVGAAVYLLTGIWTRSAATSLRRIVDTEGNDITHLMSAMTDLGKLYNLTKWAFIIAIILGFALTLVQEAVPAAEEIPNSGNM